MACVTPVRRVAGRDVRTVDGLADGLRQAWVDAFVECGASQCGFCTPGIVLRLAALAERERAADETTVRTALLAHLCRCTGWQSVVEAAGQVLGFEVPMAPRARSDARDPLLASWRAQLEGPAFQASGADAVLGRAGFADDTAPPGAAVAVPGPDGDLVVAPTLDQARRQAHKVQGRRTTVALGHPVELPDGEWALTLRTTWVEPAYLEPDASWCLPGGVPASPLANGGAFGGKRTSLVTRDARRLADATGGPVRVVWSREDVARRGPKRPPAAVAVRSDGSGIFRFVTPSDGRAAEYAARVAAAAPDLVVEPVTAAGPPVSVDLRAAGWAEAAVVRAGWEALQTGDVGPGKPVELTAPSGGRARVSVGADDRVSVEVWAGEVLDEVTLRSYCLGAVHQALGWVWREGIAVVDGEVCDLTIRSFGVVSARDTPRVDVTVHAGDGWPVGCSDAVFAATAAAAWLAEGLPPHWPTRRGDR